MAIMVRPKISATIAFAIIGKPSNLQDKPSSLQKKISKAMEGQSTRLLR